MPRIVWNQVEASGRRTSWAKPFDRVDTHIKGAKAFCFGAGDGYLRDGTETDLPEGTLVLEVKPCGSVKHSTREAIIFSAITEDGEGKLVPISEGYDFDRQYLSLVDEALAALDRRALSEDIANTNPLAVYTSEQLRAELERRTETVICICEIYTPTRETYDSVDAFLDMCAKCFGQTPKLRRISSGWIDDAGNHVLIAAGAEKDK